jgi:mannose-6-phosphate isomerase-like protein (cupin superfamily)
MKPSLSFALLAGAALVLALPGRLSSQEAAPAAVPAPVPAATRAPRTPPTEVILFDHGRVDHTFATGGALQINEHYKVQAGRRVVPGFVEIHVRDTDVFYIVDGSATFVTGGTAVDQQLVSPGEIHAKSITGGTEHQLSKGDVIIIPHGIPHQFTQVNGPFLYFVVKVTE